MVSTGMQKNIWESRGKNIKYQQHLGTPVPYSSHNVFFSNFNHSGNVGNKNIIQG